MKVSSVLVEWWQGKGSQRLKDTEKYSETRSMYAWMLVGALPSRDASNPNPSGH